MQARSKQTAENIHPEMINGIFECRRKPCNVSYVGQERRASREPFVSQHEWWLKVNFVENA